MRLFFLKLWVYLLCPIWSFFINLGYWIIHIHQLKNAIDKKRILEFRTSKINNVETIMKEFKWREDKLIDWVPWIITIVNNNLKDDCDGAAILGKFLLKAANMKSEIIYLYNKKEAHVVCISKDKKIMITNNKVVFLTGDNWEYEVLKEFNFKYKKRLK